MKKNLRREDLERSYVMRRKKKGKKIGEKAIVEIYFECETNVSSKPRNLVEKELGDFATKLSVNTEMNAK